MIKLAVGGRCGNDQDRGTDSPFAAACRRIAHGYVTLAFPLGDIGGGTAFVQLQRVNAAQRFHHASHFLQRISHRPGSHGPVCLEHHDRPVRLHADGAAGIIARIGTGACYGFSVHQNDPARYGLRHLDGPPLFFTLHRFRVRQSHAFVIHSH